MERYSDKKRKEIMEYFNTWIETQDVFKDRKHIADYLHISRSHLGNIINGVRKPSEEVLHKIIIMTGFTMRENDIKKSEKGRPYKELADELQRWFHRQERWKNQKEIAQYLGVDNSYVSKFFMGRMFPGGETREKLYTITNIDLLRPENIISPDASINEKEKTISRIDSKTINKELFQIKKILEKIEKTLKYRPSNNNKSLQNINEVEKIATTFYILAEELMSFQNSTKEERERLKRLISPKDVGFIISFLKAIYDEDKFSDFIFFTKYNLEGRV